MTAVILRRAVVDHVATRDHRHLLKRAHEAVRNVPLMAFYYPNHNAWGLDGRAAVEAALADPAVVHYTTAAIGRPWLPTCRHPRVTRWFEVLERTSWAGWRPRPPGRAQAVLRHMRATARTLATGTSVALDEGQS
jgi:hypothetical protein